MPRRRRRQLSPVELLIVVIIAGVLFAVTASSRPRSRTVRHSVSAPVSRPPRPVIPVEPPDAAKRAASPPSVLWLWRRVQNPVALALALHVIGRALRRDRRARPKSPTAHEGSPVP